MKINRPVTQADIARAAGVARSTVAAVLSGDPSFNLNKDTCARVRKIAQDLGYRPNRYAQVMREGKSGIIGILTFGFSLQIVTDRLRYSFEQIRQHGYQPLMVDIQSYYQGAREVFARFEDARIEGLLSYGLSLDELDEHYERLLSQGIAIAIVNGQARFGVDSYVSDRAQGFRDITNHMIQLGKKRIELLSIWHNKADGAPPSRHARMALDGFTQAMRAHNMPMDENSVIWCQTEAGDELPIYRTAYRYIKERLKRKPYPDALICSDDSFGIGAIRAIHEHDLKIPTDIAVSGFNDEAQSRFCYPPLTTAVQPAKEQVRMAVENIVDKIKNRRPLADGKEYFLDCEMIVRESTVGYR